MSAVPTVFLLDVDDTLLDNDHFADDLGTRLARDFGAQSRNRYFEIFDSLRTQLGYADYLAALQAFRAEHEHDPALPAMSGFLLDFPFVDLVYARAFDAIAHLRTLGRTAILSDGDIVFQPRKIIRSGIRDAVDGDVMICVHKEKSLDAMRQRFPARHYVMVDDKPNLLASMKRVLGVELTTVFVRQGHYARAAADQNFDPPPDVSIDAIGDLLGLDLDDFKHTDFKSDDLALPAKQGDANAPRSTS